MEVTHLDYPESDRLLTLLELNKAEDRHHEVGTGYLPKGCKMPDRGTSAHSRHEVSLIIEGRIRTISNGVEVVLTAGDIVSIPEKQAQCTEVIEDTRLLYIFFDK